MSQPPTLPPAHPPALLPPVDPVQQLAQQLLQQTTQPVIQPTHFPSMTLGSGPLIPPPLVQPPSQTAIQPSGAPTAQAPAHTPLSIRPGTHKWSFPPACAALPANPQKRIPKPVVPFDEQESPPRKPKATSNPPTKQPPPQDKPKHKYKNKGLSAPGREGRPRIEYVPTNDPRGYHESPPKVYEGKRTRSGKIPEAPYRYQKRIRNLPSTSDNSTSISDASSSSNQAQRSAEPSPSEPAAKRAQDSALVAPPVLAPSTSSAANSEQGGRRDPTSPASPPMVSWAASGSAQSNGTPASAEGNSWKALASQAPSHVPTAPPATSAPPAPPAQMAPVAPAASNLAPPAPMAPSAPHSLTPAPSAGIAPMPSVALPARSDLTAPAAPSAPNAVPLAPPAPHTPRLAPPAPMAPKLDPHSPTPSSDNDPPTTSGHIAPPPPVTLPRTTRTPPTDTPLPEAPPTSPADLRAQQADGTQIKPEPDVSPPPAADPPVEPAPPAPQADYPFPLADGLQGAAPPPPADLPIQPADGLLVKPDLDAPNFGISNPLNGLAADYFQQLLNGDMTIYPERLTFQPIYEAEANACIKLYNTTTYRLSYQLETNAPTRLELSPLTTSGILKPLSFVLVHIKRQGFMMAWQRNVEKDRINVRWTKTPDGTNWSLDECLEEGEPLVRNRIVKIRYST